MKLNNCDFEFERIYHVYNRAVGKELLFTELRNYDFFLQRYFKYLHTYADTFAYCLLSNHFHLLVRIKSEGEIAKLVCERSDAFQQSVVSDSEDKISCTKVIGKQFHGLFTSYAKAFNVQENRRGGLFIRPFKRKEVDNEAYLSYLIFYIHANITRHGLKKEYTNYKWSSYQEILSDLPTKICREKVLDWYGGKDRFIEYHKNAEYMLDFKYAIED